MPGAIYGPGGNRSALQFARPQGRPGRIMRGGFAPAGSLADDFSGTLSAWPGSYGTTTVVSGRARVTCDTGYSGIVTSKIYTIQNSEVYAQVFPPTTGGAATDANVSLNVQSGIAGTALDITINRVTGLIYFHNSSGYFDPNTVSITYDPVAHGWLRIRESNGTLFWETSPDGSTWTNRRATNAATPSWVLDSTTAQYIEFSAHRDSGTADYAEIDNYNTVAAGSQAAVVAMDGEGTLAVVPLVTETPAVGMAGSGSLSVSPLVTVTGPVAMAGVGTLSVAPAAGSPTTVLIDVGENHYTNSTTPTSTPALTNIVHTSTVLRSFYKFDLPAAPSGGTLIGAKLVINTTSTGDSIQTLTASTCSNSWSESTITWNTQPAADTFLATFTTPAISTQYQVDLPASVVSGFAGSTMSIVTTGDNADSTQIWGSRYNIDTTKRPDLQLVYLVPNATVTGTVLMDGSGALAVTGLVTETATVGMAGSGSLSVAPSVTHPASVGFIGGGALAVTSAATGLATVTMAGVGALAVAGIDTTSGAVGMAGAGALTVTPLVTHPVSVGFSGSGSLGVAAAITESAIIPMAGAGTLTVAAAATRTGTVAMTGAGALSVIPTVTRAGVVTMAGAGGLSVTPIVAHPATVAMAGTGTLTVTPGQTVSDDFNGTIGAIWTASSGGVSNIDGRGRIPVGTGFASFQTAAAYTILGGSAFARMYPPAAGGAATDANLGFVVNSTTAGTSLAVTINQVTGTIKFASESGYFDAAAVSITYNSTAHAWVRIREAASTTYFETSPDCSTWTVRKSITTPGWVTSTANQSYQFVGHRDAGTVDYAEVDNFNVVPEAALFTRVEFGAHADNEPYPQSAHDTLETLVGARLRRSVWFQNMDVAWLDAAAADAATTNHTIEIAWDTGPNVTLAAILAGTWDTSLDAFFQKAKAYPGTVVLRMWWEMNTTAGRYTMGYVGGDKTVTSLAQWKSAWQYIYNRAKITNTTTNVKFFYCANGSDVGAYTMEDYYPGSAYVDEIGFDTYNETAFSSWTKFDGKLGPAYKRVTALHPSAPVVIGEIGSVESAPAGTSKAAWSSEMFNSWSFPRLAQINLFSVDQSGTGGNDWRVDSSPASLAVYQTYLPLAVNGTTISRSAAVGMAGVGSLAVTPQVSHPASVAMAGSGVLSAGASVAHPGVVPMTGAGALTVAAALTRVAAVTMVGAGAFTVVGVDTTAAALTMAGVGALTVTGTTSGASAVAMAGAGTLTVVGTGTITAAVSMAGAGSLAVTATPIHLAAVTLAGSGALTVTPSITLTPAVLLAGVGALTTTAQIAHPATVPMTGAGVMTVTGTSSGINTVAFTGTGALTVAGTGTTAGTVPMTGAGALAVAASLTHTAAVTLTGAGALTVTGTRTQPATVPMVGVGALTVTGTTSSTTTVAMIGAGALTVTSTITRVAAVTMTGAGGLTVTAQTGSVQTATVTMTGTGALTVGALLTHTAALTLAGVGSLTVTSTTTATGIVPIAGAGTLTIGGTQTHPVTIVMSGAGVLNITGDVLPSNTLYNVTWEPSGAPHGNLYMVGAPNGNPYRIKTSHGNLYAVKGV